MQQRKNLKQNSSLKKNQNLKATSRLKKAGRIKPLKRPGVAKLKKEADKLHSLVVRYSAMEGDGLVQCFTCPNRKEPKVIQCGHFMSRSHNATRYSFDNTRPQCYGCNVMHQGRQYQFGLKLGSELANRLYKESQTPHPFTEAELLVIIKDRQARLDKLLLNR